MTTLTAALACGGQPQPALAIPVFDGALYSVLGNTNSILTSQNSILDESKSILGDVSEDTQGMWDAIGKAGSIAMSAANLMGLKNQLTSDVGCLLPNISDLFPDLKFLDTGFGGICQVGNRYQSILTTNAKSFTNKDGTFDMAAANVERNKVAARRDYIMQDASMKALSGGDMGVKSADQLTKAAAELKATVEAAKDQNERLAAIAQGQVVLAQAMAQLILIQSQALKLQAAYSIQMALPKDSVMPASLNGVKQ